MKMLYRIGQLVISLVFIGAVYGDAVVHLENYQANMPFFRMWGQDSPGTHVYCEVLAGPVGSNLTPLIPYGATHSVLTSRPGIEQMGFFDLGMALIPGVVDGAQADFLLRAWRGVPGSTYDHALIKGASARWTQAVDSWQPEAVPPAPPDAPSLYIPGPIGWSHYGFSARINGEGTILLEPPPVLSSYPTGALVTVTVQPKPGWEFVSWSGTLAGTNNPARITMNEDTELVAHLARILLWTLKVTVTEGGSVDINPKQTLYWDQQTVELYAPPQPGYYFAGWKGDLHVTNRYWLLTMVKNLELLACFESLPAITKHPVSQTVTNGVQAVLSVEAVGSNLTYLWHRNGAPIAGATNATYILPPATLNSGGSYHCLVSNPGRRVASNPAQITLWGPFVPSVLLSIWPGSIVAGRTAQLTAYIKCW